VMVLGPAGWSLSTKEHTKLYLMKNTSSENRSTLSIFQPPKKWWWI